MPPKAASALALGVAVYTAWGVNPFLLLYSAIFNIPLIYSTLTLVAVLPPNLSLQVEATTMPVNESVLRDFGTFTVPPVPLATEPRTGAVCSWYSYGGIAVFDLYHLYQLMPVFGIGGIGLV